MNEMDSINIFNNCSKSLERGIILSAKNKRQAVLFGAITSISE